MAEKPTRTFSPKNVFRETGLRIAVVFLLLAGMVVFLYATTPGLYILIAVAKLNLPGKIELQGLGGSLGKGATFQTLRYTEGKKNLHLTNGSIRWDVSDLLRHHRFQSIQASANWNASEWPIDKLSVIKSNKGRVIIAGDGQSVLMRLTSQIDTPFLADCEIKARFDGLNSIITSIVHLRSTNIGPKATIVAKATIQNRSNATFDVIISPGLYLFTLSQGIAPIPFLGGHIKGQLNEKALSLKGNLRVNAHQTFDGALTLPKFRLLSPMPQNQALDGKLTLTIDSLDFLKSLNKTLAPIGELRMRVSAKGTIAKPAIIGEISLNKASVAVPQIGLTINPVQLKFQSNTTHWKAQGSLMANGQPLTLKGEGLLSKEPTGKVTLEGHDIPAIKTATYDLQLSPQLTMQFTPHSLDIKGNILVPKANLTPISFHRTANLPDDVIFVDEKTTANALNITTDVNVQMGNDVTLNTKGLRGLLDGNLRIQQSPKSPLNTTGMLTIRDGTYLAYGQDLLIEQGQLIFHGTRLNNPELFIRAIRKFDETSTDASSSNHLFDFNASNLDSIALGAHTTVGVEVKGHIKSPKITLFSIPPTLSQADILSMLLLGKPASQANQAGGQLLLSAISSMNLDAGTKGVQLLQQVKQKLGIDVKMQNSESYNRQTNQVSDNTAFVVGKSFSKRIYVSYNIGLFQEDNNVLMIKYLLNKFLSIQVNTSDSGSGVDLLYSHKKDT